MSSAAAKFFTAPRAEEVRGQPQQQQGDAGVGEHGQRRAPGAAQGGGKRVGARFAPAALQQQRKAAGGQAQPRQHARHARERHARKGEFAEEDDGQKRPYGHAQRRRRARQTVAGDEADDGGRQRRQRRDGHQRSGVLTHQGGDRFQARVFQFQRQLARGEDGRHPLCRARALGGAGIAGQRDEAPRRCWKAAPG